MIARLTARLKATIDLKVNKLMCCTDVQWCLNIAVSYTSGQREITSKTHIELYLHRK